MFPIEQVITLWTLLALVITITVTCFIKTLDDYDWQIYLFFGIVFLIVTVALGIYIGVEVV